MRSVLLPVALLFFCVAVFAEMSPAVYKKMQEESPESLRIKVLSVRTSASRKPNRTVTSVAVRARVLSAERTASNIKTGSVILVEYTHTAYDQPMAGPSQVPVLSEGKVYPAFLRKAARKSLYEPAAGGFSFSQVP